MAPPKGHPRYGGRTKGTLNKHTLAYRAALRDAAGKDAASPLEEGQSPLEFLIAVMRNQALDLPVRLQAASVAAPYWHPKLSMVEAHVGVTAAPGRQLGEAGLRAIMTAIDAASALPAIVEVDHDEE